MPHMSLRNLTIKYGDQEVLRDITVDIPDSRITTIIGPSGCGKTTLLKSLNRLLDLNEDVTVNGDILIDGVSTYGQNADILALRKKVGFLAQRPYPLPMSIYDNIAFGPRVHRMDGEQIERQLSELQEQNFLPRSSSEGARLLRHMTKKRRMDLLVESYLRLAGLWDEVKDRLNAPASLLSIGQQQRLALARALSVEPEVILADEPTSALDPISAKLIEQRFRMLKEKYTIVVVTHILRQARRISDYAIFLYLGELVEHGPSDQFFSAPQDERTRAYISGEIS
jgi:phosphate transport system ATP-binding protein